MLFTDTQPSTGRYTGAFSALDYGNDVARLNKFDKAAGNGYKYGKPIGDAAIGILSAIAGPFGPLIGAAYGGGSLGVNALVKAHRNQLAKKVENDARMNDMPAFGYGFDANGIFHQTHSEVPQTPISTGNYATDSNLGMGFGSALGKAFAPVSPTAPSVDNYSPTNGTYPTFNYTPSIPTNYGTPVNTTQSQGNMDWNNQWNGGGETEYAPPTQNMKYGGKVVIGGKGQDDIALVDTNTGGDTGVRVSKGEMLVVNKDRLHALKKAINSKNKKEVFNIIKAQVDEVPQDNHFAGGGRGYVEPYQMPTYGANFVQTESPYFIENQPLEANTISTQPPYANGFGAYQDFNGGAVYPNAATPTQSVNAAGLIVPQRTVATATTPKEKFDWQDAVTNGMGYGWDAFRLGEGLSAANKALPVYQKPYAWNELLGRIRQNSYHGLTPEQAAAYHLDADRTYATNVANVYNLAGGNAGLALSNLGTANLDRYGTNLKLAALDSELQNKNLDTYGNYLGKDMALDRQIFNDKNDIAMLNKQAGAKLAQDAIKNMEERNTTNTYYGAGSQQSKLEKMYLQRMQDENDILKANKEYYINNPDAFKPFASSGSYDPTKGSEYDDYLKGGGTLPYAEFIKTASTKTKTKKKK